MRANVATRRRHGPVPACSGLGVDPAGPVGGRGTATEKAIKPQAKTYPGFARVAPNKKLVRAECNVEWSGPELFAHTTGKTLRVCCACKGSAHDSASTVHLGHPADPHYPNALLSRSTPFQPLLTGRTKWWYASLLMPRGVSSHQLRIINGL